MSRRADGQLLKTKVVATMGAPRAGVFGADFEPLGSYARPEEFWNRFMQQFCHESQFLVDVVRLNMAFYRIDGQPAGEFQRQVLAWLRDNADLSRNTAVLGDLPGPKLRTASDTPSRRVEDGELVLALGTERPRAASASGSGRGRCSRRTKMRRSTSNNSPVPIPRSWWWSATAGSRSKAM